MIEATIAAVGEKGYSELTVADVIRGAGVSRRAFYEHFSNREACFLASYDWIMAESAAALGSVFNGGDGISGGVQDAIRVIFERALRRPDAVRMLFVEVGAVGPKGLARREELGAAHESLLRERLGLPPGPGPIPNPVLRGVIGGISAVLNSQIQEGRPRQRLAELVPDLVRWATSYWPAPAELLSLVDASPETLPRERVGGRAPGTLSLGAAASKRRRLVGGENGVSPLYVAHSQRERILDAIANLTAERGYAGLTVEAIAAQAAVSLQAFYEHFPSKDDAFLAAYEIGHHKGLALVERAFDAQHDWCLGVRAGIAALFDYLASEPAFAHLALVDVHAALGGAAERASRGITTYAGMLTAGFEEASHESRPPNIAREAIAGGLFELCLHHALQRRIHELPLMVPRATYFALAPFVGANEAGRIAVAAN
jgi:AcrR family transcriptional regulator